MRLPTLRFARHYAATCYAAVRTGMLIVCFITIGVTHSQAAEPTVSTAPVSISFELDVQPLLTRAGCNAGACHGKQRGQNGFQLSLFGFDSDFDYDAIVNSARGRRIFPAAPAASLLLQKATAELPHGGGERFTVESAAYRTLTTWIARGAPRTTADEPQLLSVELAESNFRIAPEESRALQVLARYSDETVRDVTSLATYLSNDAAVAAVSPEGVLTAGKLFGETAIMVRYMNRIEVANVVIPYRSSSSSSAPAPSLPRRNFIDDLVFKKIELAGMHPSEAISDATFLRRATTDLIGRFPTVEESRTFLESQATDKRELLVDQLLSKPEYADHWANQWADLLRPNPYRVGIKAVFNYDNWIREQFRNNVPYDDFVRQLITAKGSTWRNGAVTLYRDRRTPDEMATLVSQLFLGVRLECAKCHHHPFENWSQDDFYEFAAFFAKVDFKGTGLSPPISGGEETVFASSTGEVRHPLSGKVMQAEPLFGAITADVTLADAATPVAPVDPREHLAAWMTSPDNHYFAQVQVNRVWAALMGRGLVDPVDDLRSTNPASNPELLAALAEHFQQSGYDLKALLKTIALSSAYSLSSIPNETNSGDRLNYSRHYRHRFRAEVLADAIAAITETEHEMRGMPVGSRANQVWTHRVSSLFLDTFGRPDENQDPPCERTSDSTVTQALHLMNSRELDSRVRSDTGRAARLAGSGATAAEVAEELYLAIFSRYPSPDERKFAIEILDVEQQADSEQTTAARRRAIEDLMWAMLNAPECMIQD